VKPSVHPLLLMATIALLLLVSAAPATAREAAPAPVQPAAAPSAQPAADEGPSAAERRAAESEFEREKLDSAAFGEAKEDTKKDEGSGAAESSASLGRFLFGLVVVVALIYGIHWLLKQWGQSRLQGVAGRAGVIDVVATTPLAQGRTLHLVRLGDELVLVGATDQSITRIGEMDARAFGASAADRGAGDFQAMLNGAMVAGQPGVPAGMGGTTSANEPFVKRFLDNLRMTTAR
jgi:flagellar biosynthetic protein FliO